MADLLRFFVLVWLTLQVSRLLRYVLDREVYTRVSLAPGIPYALNSILNYVVLIGGLLIGLVLAGMGTFLARFQARRHGRRVARRLRLATDEVVDTELVKPLRTETCRWAQLAQILNRITSTDIS